MTIKDLLRNGEHRFERLGSIRLGVKEPVLDKRGRQRKDKHGQPLFRPVATEYFVVPDEVAEAVGNDKPTRLVVFLPFDESERVLDDYHRLYTRSSLICRGDGECINYAIRPETGEVLVRGGLAAAQFSEDGRAFEPGQPVPCPGFDHSYGKCEGCKAVANLRVMVRGLYRLGYWQISTGSINSILNIKGTLDWTLRWFGRLTGIPFLLRLEAEELSCPMEIDGKKVRRRQTKYIMHLEVDPEWVEAHIRRAQAESLPRVEKPPALPRPQIAEVEDGAEEAEEAEEAPEIFDNGDVVEGVVEDVPPVVEDARAEDDGFNGFWAWIYGDYAEKTGYDGDAARAAGQKALEEGGDVQRARWILLLEIAALSEKEVKAALGTTVWEWLTAEEGRTLENAISEALAVAGKGAK